MKKLFYSMFSLLFVFILLLLFLDYSNLNYYSIERETLPVEIEKKFDKTNEEFINEIEEICEYNGLDIMYKKINGKSEKREIEYYITNYNNTFLCNIIDIYNFQKEGYLSTKNCSLDGSILFGDISIFNFGDIEKYNLDCSIFYLREQDVRIFSKRMIALGYNVHVINETSLFKRYFTANSVLLPTFLFLATGFAFFIYMKKEYAIKKLNGYKNLDICIECIGNVARNMLILSLVAFLVNLFLIHFYIDRGMLQYLKYTLPRIGVFILGTLALFIAELEVTLHSINAKNIKGSNVNRGFYYFVVLAQLVFLIWGLLNIGNMSKSIHNLYNIYQGKKESLKDMEGFVSMPLNVFNKYIGDDNQLEYNKVMVDFYNETVNAFDGILISTTNYRSLNGEETLAEKYSQLDITVNTNYLNLNPIYDIEGNLIDSFPENKLNIIAPQNINMDMLEAYYLPYEVTEDDINLTFMKADTKIKTYNPYSGTNGFITDPIIYVYNEKFFWNQMMNYISGEYYLLKTETTDAYSEIYPILDENNLEDLIPETPLVSSRFEESISYVIRDMLWCTIMMGINIIAIICFIIYAVRLFFGLFPKEIAVKKVMGYGMFAIYNELLVHQFLCMIIVCFFAYYNSIPFTYIYKIIALQIILIEYFIKHFDALHINKYLKGGG